jgi:hypothetical protein
MRRPALAPALLTAGLAGLLLGPALPRLHRHFLGIAEVDHFGTQWFYQFTQRGLLEGSSLLRTEQFFHPWGKDVLLHTGANLLDAVLALPLRLLLGPVLGYNLFLILGLVASGWAFSRLARHFVDHRPTVVATSALFACSPFVLYEAAEGRPTQAITALIPLFLLQAWRAGESRGWRAPVLGGVLLALLGYQYWYYAIFGGFVAAALGAWRALLPPEGSGGRAGVVGRHSAMAGVALVLVAPVALPMLLRTELGGAEVPGLLDVAAWGWGSGLAPVTQEGHRIALLGWQPLLGQAAYFMQDEAGAQRLVGHQQVPSVALLLVLLAWLRAPGRLDRGGFGVALATAAILAVGPMVLVGGLVLPNLPYLLLTKTFGFMQRLWWPARALAFVDVLAFLALAVVLARAARLGPRGHGAVLLGVGLTLVAGLARAGLLPFPTWDASIPAGYRCLAQGEPGALIELPYGWTQAHLYYQSAHGRPIMGGMLERNPVFIPEQARALREDNRFVAGLLQAAATGDEPATEGLEDDREATIALGYRWVVLQRDAYFMANEHHDEEEQAALLRVQQTRLRRVERELEALLGPAAYADGRLRIYPIGGADPDTLPCAVGHDGWTPDPEPVAPRPMSATSSVKALPVRYLD